MEIPEPRYKYDKRKELCRVCKGALIMPKGNLTARQKLFMQKMFNRSLCSIECLFKSYDDLEDYSDKLFELIRFQEDLICDLKEQNRILKEWP